MRGNPIVAGSAAGLPRGAGGRQVARRRRGGDPGGWLDTCHDARRLHRRAVQRHPAARGQGVLSHTDPAREFAFNFLSQLGIHYGPGSVVMDETGRHGHARFWKEGPACGHRAPNASFARHCDGFDLLAGYHSLSRQPLARDGTGTLCAGLAALPWPSGPGLEPHVVVYRTAGGVGTRC